MAGLEGWVLKAYQSRNPLLTVEAGLIRWFPATDRAGRLPVSTQGARRPEELFRLLRPAVLDALLPVPRDPVPADVLARFRPAIAPRLTDARALLAAYGIPCLVDAAPSRVLSWLPADDERL